MRPRQTLEFLDCFAHKFNAQHTTFVRCIEHTFHYVMLSRIGKYITAVRTPTYLYVDEAQDYFDETIKSLLTQGRKFNFGLILAHQNLAQLRPRLRAVIMGNTTIKVVGGVSDSDARALALDMRTTTNDSGQGLCQQFNC